MKRRGRHEASRHGLTVGAMMNRYGCLYDPNLDALWFEDEYLIPEDNGWTWNDNAGRWEAWRG